MKEKYLFGIIVLLLHPGELVLERSKEFFRFLSDESRNQKQIEEYIQSRIYKDIPFDVTQKNMYETFNILLSFTFVMKSLQIECNKYSKYTIDNLKVREMQIKLSSSYSFEEPKFELFCDIILGEDISDYLSLNKLNKMRDYNEIRVGDIFSFDIGTYNSNILTKVSSKLFFLVIDKTKDALKIVRLKEDILYKLSSLELNLSYEDFYDDWIHVVYYSDYYNLMDDTRFSVINRIDIRKLLVDKGIINRLDIGLYTYYNSTNMYESLVWKLCKMINQSTNVFTKNFKEILKTHYL